MSNGDAAGKRHLFLSYNVHGICDPRLRACYSARLFMTSFLFTARNKAHIIHTSQVIQPNLGLWCTQIRRRSPPLQCAAALLPFLNGMFALNQNRTAAPKRNHDNVGPHNTTAPRSRSVVKHGAAEAAAMHRSHSTAEIVKILPK